MRTGQQQQYNKGRRQSTPSLTQCREQEECLTVPQPLHPTITPDRPVRPTRLRTCCSSSAKGSHCGDVVSVAPFAFFFPTLPFAFVLIYPSVSASLTTPYFFIFFNTRILPAFLVHPRDSVRGRRFVPFHLPQAPFHWVPQRRFGHFSP